jgi:AcrR family transcriptional regulator
MNVAVSTKPKPGRNSDRAYRTRLAITDAFVNLIEEGDLSPSMPDVANRAGVSLRSLYYHFRNAESLYESVIRRQEPLISRVLVSIDHVSPLRNRAHNLVAQRCEIYRHIAPLRRAVQLNADARNSLTIRTARRRLEYVLARHANETFAPELREAADRFGASERIAAVTSFEMWDYLSRVRQLSASRVKRHMIVAVLRELGV